MVSPYNGIADFAIQLSQINNSNRPKIFKNKSHNELERWIKEAHKELRRMFGEEVDFFTTDVNIKGADLRVEGTNQWVELKTGLVTDANAGISTIAWAMGDENNSELRKIMNDSMVSRRKLAEVGDFQRVKQSKEDTMRQLERYFKDRLTENESAPPILQHYSRCVARSITKKHESERLYGKPESEWNIPRVLHANYNSGWIEVYRPFNINEDIIVHKISRGTSTSSKVSRVQLQLKGVSSNRTALYYPTYKNSYNDKRGNRIAASNWVQTACFHVWIGK